MSLVDIQNPAHRNQLRQLYRYAKKELNRRTQGVEPWLRFRDKPVEFITKILRQHRGDSWRSWRIIIKAAHGKPLDPDELEFFKIVSGGRNPPTRRVKELWCIVGRRGGKDSTASVMALEAARNVETQYLRPGEDAIIPCIACTREQAEVVWKYTRGYFETIPSLRAWLANPKMTGGVIRLKNKVEIRVTTNNFRVTRAFAVPAVIFDEVAFYRDEESATPDIETYRAIRPATLTLPNAIMIGISSPHKRSGLLYQKYQDHYGKDDDDVLVIKADTRTMNPQVERFYPGEIEKAYEEDPERAAAEYGAEFRKDLEDYVSREVVMAAVQQGVFEIAPDITKSTPYVGFADPSGGARDSFTLAIAHYDIYKQKAVLDCVRETRAPLIPQQVCKEYAETCRAYGLSSIKGDRYAGVWPAAEFAEHGIIYEPAEMTKSEMYVQFMPALNSGKAELLDHRRLITQFCGLERRTVRGGRDSVDHPKDGYDDIANAVTGALLECQDSDMAVVRRYLGA